MSFSLEEFLHFKVMNEPREHLLYGDIERTYSVEDSVPVKFYGISKSKVVYPVEHVEPVEYKKLLIAKEKQEIKNKKRN